MVRVPLTDAERRRGRRLGELLREARAQRSMVEIAAAAGLSAETLRKIETGRIATPALFTVAALADVLDLSLDVVVSATAHEGTCDPRSGTTALPNAITDIRTRSAAEH